MKWFQHDADASHDAKVKKLILRHGAEGYAVYFHCLELIAGDLSQTNINFELEHDAEIIADNLKIRSENNIASIDKVNNILKSIVSLGLFTMQNNRVFCYKMAHRLDNTVSRSPEINKIKQKRIDYVADTKKLGAEDNTTHNNTIDNNTLEQFNKFWLLYDKKINKPYCIKKWNKLKEEEHNNILTSLKAYIKATPDKQYRKHPATYLNNRTWEDEIVTKATPPTWQEKKYIPILTDMGFTKPDELKALCDFCISENKDVQEMRNHISEYKKDYNQYLIKQGVRK